MISMYDFLRSLISNHLYAILAVLMIWFVLFITLYRIRKIKSFNWVRLEYVWVFFGFLGVLAIVEDNRKEFDKQNLDIIELWIDRDYEMILSDSKNQYNCIRFNYNSDLVTLEKFDSIQKRQDKICQWSKELNSYVDSCYKSDKPILSNIPILEISNPENEIPYQVVLNTIGRLNENVNEREELKSNLKRSSWMRINSGFGVVFLFFAFGLRFAIISYKVRAEKNKLKVQ